MTIQQIVSDSQIASNYLRSTLYLLRNDKIDFKN